MFVSVSMLKGYLLDGLDGAMGKVREFYLDDRFWTVRYLVADIGRWLTGKEVLISPRDVVNVVEEKQQIGVNLTKKQIEESPSLESANPASHPCEEDSHSSPANGDGTEGPRALNPHLRSTREVISCKVTALDGEIGHVQDLIVDDSTWEIAHAVVSTLYWLPGKRFLISPQWIKAVNWGEWKLSVDLTREEIKCSPEYLEGAL